MNISTSIILPALTKASTSFLINLFRNYKRKTREKTLEKEVSKFISTFLDTPLDSGVFIEFLKLDSTDREFTEYIEYCAYRKQEHKEKFKDFLTKEIFLDHISQKAVSYMQDANFKKVELNLVVSYFEEVMDILEIKLISLMDIEKLGILYFFNNSMMEMQDRILESIKSNVTYIDRNFEKIYFDYINIIKKRNSTSFVYGIEDLNLYSFYVFPEFNVIESSTLKSNSNLFLEGEYESNYEQVKWQDIFKESNMISIIGGAGFGKSLFLKNIINKFPELNIHGSNYFMPIYCDLKQFNINSKLVPAYSIKDFLRHSITTTSGLDGDAISKEFLDYFLEEGRCLILFDALDEVEIEDRKDLNNLISSFFSTTNKHNKFIITSRSQGFIPETRLVYQVCPVNQDQIKIYLENMIKLKQFQTEYIKEFLAQCEVLIDQGFLTSFLTLSLLVQIYKSEKELPESKIELYEKCVEYTSKKREKEKKKSNFNFSLMSNILDNNISFEKLSWLSRPYNIEVSDKDIKDFFIDLYKETYSSENETRNAISEFLRFCTQRTELYVAGTKEMYYRFYHRSFYEFFYSKCIINEFSDNENLFKALEIFGFESEMFELTINLLKNHNYDRLKSFSKYLIDLIDVDDLSSINGDEKNFFRVCIMLNNSDQLQHCNKIYEFCFSEKRLLNNIEDDTYSEHILPLLLKVSKKMSRNLSEDLLEFYEKEIVSVFLFMELATTILRDPRDLILKFKKLLTFSPLISRVEKRDLMKIVKELSLEQRHQILMDEWSLEENEIEEVSKNMLEALAEIHF